MHVHSSYFGSIGITAPVDGTVFFWKSFATRTRAANEEPESVKGIYKPRKSLYCSKVQLGLVMMEAKYSRTRFFPLLQEVHYLKKVIKHAILEVSSVYESKTKVCQPVWKPSRGDFVPQMTIRREAGHRVA